jgi:catechol 2,3-dioxygenase-like lactoylglutathione lyase family enzyme
MKIKQIDHLNLSVTNFQTTFDWYKRLFGFELVENGVMDGHPWGVIRSGEAMLCIYEKPQMTMQDPDYPHLMHSINHFGFRISDPKKWESVIKSEDVKIDYGGSAIEWPHSRSWYLRDPNGFKIEVTCWNNDQIQF